MQTQGETSSGLHAGRDARGSAHVAKRRLKAVLGQLLYRSGIYRAMWKDRAVIVLFHRVDDRYPGNPITCSRALFAAFCDFFKQYFEVVSLSDLVESMGRGDDISRRLVITFDDAYRDNYEFAAIELRKRGLPATFFIPTGFVGSNRPAWWDEQSSIQSEWMSWQQVRELLDHGFELGTHTITHADCGQIRGADAIREIAGAKSQLEAATGASVRHFAFPYGDDSRMTEENRAIVRSADYRSCLAANGGTVRPSDSPFHLKRAPINAWYMSPYQFGFETISIARSHERASRRQT